MKLMKMMGVPLGKRFAGQLLAIKRYEIDVPAPSVAIWQPIYPTRVL
jgi:hypothetical protein